MRGEYGISRAVVRLGKGSRTIQEGVGDGGSRGWGRRSRRGRGGSLAEGESDGRRNWGWRY